ncbi:hypothetical protein [Streptomyces sp. NPDC048386]|uniref:hypothetical protein n=1 Tax=Streptomyces sp. NPDC048386 TaxID=3365541 RepID=UPI00371BE8C9
MSPDFTETKTSSLVVAGAHDQSPLTVRGPDWFSDAYRLSPGATELLPQFGAEHGLGGIPGANDTRTTDENPERVALDQHATWAYLRTAVGLDNDAWPAASVTGRDQRPAGKHRPEVTTPLAPARKPSFGIMTAPAQVTYADVPRAWHEADSIPQIEHAWLFDHLMPLGGDPNGPRRQAGHRRHR